MLIYFRLSSEHAGAYRECPVETSTITVGELKQLLARKCGFAAEFRRKIDFKVFLVSSNASKVEGDTTEELVEAESEEQRVQGFSRVVLQRTVVRGHSCQDVLQHNARTELTANEWATAEGRQGRGKKRRLPPEWICGICGGLMRQPLLVKCASNCGHSACRSCVEAKLKEQHACPFCFSSFRQVIRNKRLEEILKNINMDDYEQPVATEQRKQAEDFQAPTPANASPSDGPVADRAGVRQGRFLGTSPVHRENEAGVVTRPSGGGLGVPSQTAGPVRGPAGYSASVSRVFPRHFVYFLPLRNLQLMRHYDMMTVDAASELAASLANACVREAESAAAAALGAAAPAATAASSAAGDAASGIPSQEEFLLVPCCLSGGGSSYSIGGFVRLRADNRVPPTDRVALDLLSQWQLHGPAQGAPAPPVYTEAGMGGALGAPASTFVLRVNWIEKYGRMPMLPARKQPLCGLFGGSRRGPSGVGGGLCSGGFQAQGLFKRTALGSSVEVSVDEGKYCEVVSCVRDYVQYGSRSSDPWRQGPLIGDTFAPSSVQAGLGCPGATTKAPDSYTAAKNSPSRFRASALGGSSTGEAAPLSVASLLSLASAQVSSLRQQQQQSGAFGMAAAGGGPKPLALPGRPPDPNNPFVGYTAILPFLSEEQFAHVRKLQLKALKRAGIVPKSFRIDALTGFSCGSSTSKRLSFKSNVSQREEASSSAPARALITVTPTSATAAAIAAGQRKPLPPISACAAATTGAPQAPSTALATAKGGASAPVKALTAAGAPVVEGLLAANSFKGTPGLVASASQCPVGAPKRPQGASVLKGRRAPVVVPPPLKRLRAEIGQGTTGPPAVRRSDTPGSSVPCFHGGLQQQASLGSAGTPSVSLGDTSESVGGPVCPRRRAGDGAERPLECLATPSPVERAEQQVGCRDSSAHKANGRSEGDPAGAGASASDLLAWRCAVETLHTDQGEGAALKPTIQAEAEAHQ